MTVLPEVVSFSDVGLTGLVTVGILLLFAGRLVPYRWHREILDRCEVLEDRVRTKDEIIEQLTEANLELVQELTPTVNQILNGLPVPRKGEGE